ncbi:TPA: HAMP domain-containing histidine kinase [Pseudomonas aeruginosa]|nr:HAMP domain-containing histidine kinase [Pseudomonas aeruginosa]
MARPKKNLKPKSARAGRTSTLKGPGFRVAARTLLHLGRELITSDEIAINELLKNSFDAGSPTVKVRLVCPVPSMLLHKIAAQLRKNARPVAQQLDGVIEQLSAAATKRGKGAATTEYFDATISRLRRAKTIEDAVKIVEEVNFVEVVDTGCGISESNLLPVFLTVGTDFKVASQPPANVDEYLGNKGIGRLAMMRLGERAYVETWVAEATRVSAVEFDWRRFNNAALQISDVPVDVRKIPRATDVPSGTIVRIFALRSDWGAESEQIKDLQSFIRRLRSPFSKARRFRISVSLNDLPPIAFPPLPDEVRSLADQYLLLDFYPQKAKETKDEVLTVSLKVAPGDDSADVQTRSAGIVGGSLLEGSAISLDELKAIGPFKLHIMRFNRRSVREKTKDWNSIIRPELDIWSGGIAIYRDGFRVGFTGSERDGDWLGLDHKALRGSGYIVNRIQVVGALEITHKGNPQLIDLTNREGLVTTPEAELLKLLLLKYAISPLRSLVEANDEALKRQELENLVNEGTSTLNDRLTLAKQEVASLKSEIPKSLRATVNSLDEHLHFITTQVTKFETAIEKASEGREDILELAGIGNVMHGVMHELTRTTAQTRKLMLELAQDADEDTQALLNKLEEEIRAINTRLRQLDPLMPGARHAKRDIEIVKLTQTILKGYASRFTRHGIDHEITVTPKDATAKVRMVPGFLSLALENLISNSVYWIGKRKDTSERGLIEIEIDAKSSTITVTDNGPGILPTDRERVFQPGFSLRAKGKGYGLYLAREVAEYHGGRLYLDPAGGDDGQLRTFILELPGAEK